MMAKGKSSHKEQNIDSFHEYKYWAKGWIKSDDYKNTTFYFD